MMPKRSKQFTRGVTRANCAGVMILLVTLCQYLIPTVFLGILRLCGTDTAAAFWGMPNARYLCLYLLMYILMMGIPLVLCARIIAPKAALHPTPYRLSADRRLHLTLCGVSLCVIANIFTSFFTNLLYDIGLPAASLPAMGDGSLAILLFDLLVYAIVPAILEELLLRGILLQTMRPLGDRMAIFWSALLFGLLHGNLTQTPYAFLMGLILGALFIHTQSLRLVIVVHALANTSAMIMYYLRTFFDTATASLWGLILLVVVLMLGGVASLWLWRHPPTHPHEQNTVPSKARRRAIANAPLLWLALLMLIVILILRTV